MKLKRFYTQRQMCTEVMSRALCASLRVPRHRTGKSAIRSRHVDGPDEPRAHGFHRAETSGRSRIPPSDVDRRPLKIREEDRTWTWQDETTAGLDKTGWSQPDDVPGHGGPAAGPRFRLSLLWAVPVSETSKRRLFYLFL